MAKIKTVTLKLKVPRVEARGPLAFEQVLASLHGLLSKQAHKHANEVVSFEIVRMEGEVYFYIIVPAHLRTLLSSQLYAQYPAVEITMAPNYLTKGVFRDRQLLVGSLKPDKPWIFPFKRYPQFEDRVKQQFEDPLGPITSALSHLHHNSDVAIVQIVVGPVRPGWNKLAQKVLRRFFGTGPWQWEWFRRLYQWARLPLSFSQRCWRAPIWTLLLLIGGFSRSKNARMSGNVNDNDDDDDLDREEQSTGRHDKETVFGAAYDKLSRLSFATNVRMLYLHNDPDALHAEAKMREIAGTFQQFSLTQMNYFALDKIGRSTKNNVFRNLVRRRLHNPFVLSQEELATIFHLPTETVTTPNIAWISSPALEPPTGLPDGDKDNVCALGRLYFRHQNQTYGLLPDDRLRHTYIIGKTGMGKSTLLENMIYTDIVSGKGVGIIDPHGDLADAVLGFVPKNRINDVMLLEPADKNFPIAFNLLEGKDPEYRSLLASGLVGVFKKLYADSWGPRLEHFLRNTILALIEAPDTTMLGITRMLVDKDYRQKVLKYVKDPMVLSFWANEFSALAPQKLAEAVGPIQNKVGQFLAAPVIRNIVGQTRSTVDLRFAMDSGKIVLINLSKGKIGEDNAAMLGSLLITKFQIDAMSRANIPEAERRDFFLFVDEFQNFATDSFATILSEARKYHLSLTMANQYMAQMSEEVSAAVFGNVGTLVSFQVGIDDAKVLSQQFDEERVLPIYLASLPKYRVYNRLIVNGVTTPVFSGATLQPPVLEEPTTIAQRTELIRRLSRERYAKPCNKVEETIHRWSVTNNKPEENSKKPKKKNKK